MITILIVDDEPVNLLLLESILENKYKIITASSVKHARNIILTKKIDLIISDYNMPFENGIQFLMWLNKNQINIPFIFVTAGIPENQLDVAKNLGVNNIIEKPFSIRNISEKIDSIVESKILSFM